MKTRYVYILISCIICIVGCKNNQATEPDKNSTSQKMIEHTLFFLYGLSPPQSWTGLVRSYDTVFASFAEIIIDSSKHYIADNKGYFVIDSISEGNHIVEINHKYFDRYCNRIDIKNNDGSFVQLNPKLVDYFPLCVGKKWEFEHNYRDFYPAYGIDSTFKGNIYWNVQTENSPGSFILREIRFGTGSYKSQYHPERNNSSIVGPDTAYFLLAIDSSSTIRGTSPFFENTLISKRYYFPTEDIITMRNGDQWIKVQKETGLVYWSYGNGGNHTISNTLVLLSTED